MKRIIIGLLFIILLTSNVYAVEYNGIYLKDGWHLVKATDGKNNNWAYYKNGVEKLRYDYLYYAHRGWGTAPENSIDAIKLVKKNGYLAYETDIRFTKDNVAVLSHDSTINRIARNKDLSKISKDIKVKDNTLAEINKYSFVTTRGGTVLKNYAGSKITTFEEALKYSKENGLAIAIELKTGNEQQIASVVDMVKRYDMDNVVKWISFNEQLLNYVKKADPDELIQVLASTTAERKKKEKNLIIKTNVVFIDVTVPSSTPNLPEKQSSSLMGPHALKTIPQAKVMVDSQKVSILPNEKETIKFTYQGDGELVCKSKDESYVNCSIDRAKNALTISGIKLTKSPVIVEVYVKQGTKYSASNIIKINVNVELIQSKVILNDLTKNYDGNKVNVKATVELADKETFTGKINYKYYKGSICKGDIIDNPVNAGDYSVKAFIDKTDRYNASESTCRKIKIKRISPTLEVDNKKYVINNKVEIPFKYNGDGKLKCSSTQNRVTCNIENNKLIINAQDNKDVTIKLIASSGINYEGKEISITLAKNNNPFSSINFKNNVSIYLIILVIITLLIITLIKIFKKNKKEV